ncbi:unnamed protein product [Mucor fragilis]
MSDVSASIFYNTNKDTGINVAGLHCEVQGAGTLSHPVVYNQRGLLSYLVPGIASASMSAATTTSIAAVAPVVTSVAAPASHFASAFAAPPVASFASVKSNILTRFHLISSWSILRFSG